MIKNQFFFIAIMIAMSLSQTLCSQASQAEVKAAQSAVDGAQAEVDAAQEKLKAAQEKLQSLQGSKKQKTSIQRPKLTQKQLIEAASQAKSKPAKADQAAALAEGGYW